jgi:hypothetical protein
VSNSGANVGYEAQLWQMANGLRGSMDAADYKNVVLDLIFLKYISDAFEGLRAKRTPCGAGIRAVQETVQAHQRSRRRAVPHHAYASRVVSSGGGSWSSLIMPGSRVRVPPLLSTK